MTTENIPTDPKPEQTPEERAEAMATVGREQATINGRPGSQGSTQEPDLATRPDNIPEKFWDAETGLPRMDDIMASYGELEAKQSKPEEKPDAKPEGDTEGKPEGDEKPDDGDTPTVASAVENAQQVYAETGELNEAALDQLKKAGFDEATITSYLDGVKAQEEVLNAKAYKAAGGEEQFNAMLKWAGENFTDAEAASFDSQIANKDTMSLTISGLKAQYEAAVGTDGNLTEAGDGPSVGDVFGDKSEMVTAMGDPRYSKSSAYRKEVQDKLHRSKKAGTI